jgi:hypothetical protein
MGAEGVTQQELGLVGEFCWPDKFRVGNRALLELDFLSGHPYFAIGAQLEALLELL